MIDLNAVLSTALNQIIAEQLTEIRQMYANQMGEMAQKLNEIEKRVELTVPSNLNSMITEVAKKAAEEAIEEHTTDYDHDDFAVESDLDIDTMINDAVSNLRFDISVS